MKKPKLTVTSDFTKDLQSILKSFKKDAVLVGVPEETSGRRDGEINNATLLAINNFGSPRHNIPPRPVLQLGIEKAKDQISAALGKAAEVALSGGQEAVNNYYERAGSIAANSIKKVINSQEGFPGPAPATLASRKRDGFAGTSSLIVTGQLRNSITYVLGKDA